MPVFLVVFFILSIGHLGVSAKPNILFIFADDHAFDCVGFMGNEEIRTPHLDELAERSTVFTHTYNPGGWHGAVCVASRGMLMTGRQLWQARPPRAKQLGDEGRLWPQLMEKEGYQTYFTGKWHVEGDTLCSKVWQNTRNIRPGMPHPVNKDQYKRTFSAETPSWSPTDRSQGGFWEGGKHWSEVLADDAEIFFQQVKDKDSPFFMMLSFNAPHDPRQSPEEFVDLYPPDKIAVPENFVSHYPHDFGDRKVRDEMLAPFPRTKRSVQVNRAEYYALISHMDAQIGRILNSLHAAGKADDTVIIFTADHGLACGHHGLMGKQNQHDPSVRVPFLIAGPGIPAGRRMDHPIYLQDAMATALDLAGSSAKTDFRSVIPLLRGDLGAARSFAIGSYREHQRMITKGEYKLIIYPKIGINLLYNLKTDPLETNNLADDPSHAGRLQELRSQLSEAMRAGGDPIEL